MDHKNLDVFTGFDKIKTNLTKPFNFKTDVDFNKLTILCGTNGVGKSFVNKLLWANSFYFNIMMMENFYGVKFNDKRSNEENLEFILNSTFDEQEFEGTVKLYSSDDITNVPHYYLEYTLVNGKVQDLDFDFPSKAQPSSPPVYLSKTTRDFDFLERYIKTKKMLGITNIETNEDLDKLVEWFKLYDIFGADQMIVKFSLIGDFVKKWKEINPDLVQELDVVNLFVKDDKIYAEKTNGDIVRGTTLGAGVQAMLIMFTTAF